MNSWEGCGKNNKEGYIGLLRYGEMKMGKEEKKVENIERKKVMVERMLEKGRKEVKGRNDQRY